MATDSRRYNPATRRSGGNLPPQKAGMATDSRRYNSATRRSGGNLPPQIGFIVIKRYRIDVVTLA